MRAAREKKYEAVEGVARLRHMLSLVVLLLFASSALLLLFIGRRAVAVTSKVELETPSDTSASTPSTPVQNYSKFSHFAPGEHAALASRYSCNICHKRGDNSIEPRLPGHRECINCHQTQFNTPGTPFCTICHTQEGLSQQNPPVKAFPRSLAGFDAEYDHAQHMAGSPAAKPQTGCVACHAPARRGIARTFPDGLAAHQTCYTCHTPGRQSGGRDISSCGVCHAPGRAANISIVTRSYGIGFSHATHGPRQNLSCENCHTIGRRGLPEGKQVTATTPAQHFTNTRAQTCSSCHNDQRAFGETKFNDCKRCHTGPTFRL